MVRKIGFAVIGTAAIAALALAWYRPAAPTVSRDAKGDRLTTSGQPQTAGMTSQALHGSDESAQVQDSRQEAAPSSASAASSAHSFHWNTTLAPGESAITDGYEGLSGEFVFSKLTPSLSSDKNGNARIEVMTENFELDVAGGKESLFDAPLTLTPGIESSAAYATKEGTYRVFIKATPGSNGQSISLETHGALEPGPTQAPVTGE